MKYLAILFLVFGIVFCNHSYAYGPVVKHDLGIASQSRSALQTARIDLPYAQLAPRIPLDTPSRATRDSVTSGQRNGPTATVTAAALPLKISAAQFDFCLQDDTNPGNVVLVNISTGEYSFCCGGVLIAGGTGTLNVKGGIGSIDNAKGDRRVHIQWDTSANNSNGVGTAIVQKLSDKIVCQISDRNMSNNNCQCSNSSLVGSATINPDAIFVGESAAVTVRVPIPYDPSRGVPLVTLQRVNASGSPINAEGDLTDDGNLSNGDEIAGDGVFSLRKLFSSQVEERIRLRIVFQQGTLVGLSSVFFLDVFTHLSDAQLTTILNQQATATQSYNSLVPSVGRDAARDMVLAQIQQDPNILQAGVSDSAAGIWMLYSSGVLGALNLNTVDTQGGNVSPGNEVERTVQMHASRGPERMLPIQTASSGDTNGIKSKKAIVLAAFISQFGSSDMAPPVRQILQNLSCPTLDVTYLENSSVTVDVVKTLNQYGIVVINTHGDSYYKGLFSLYQDIFGWSLPGAQVVFYTAQTATQSNKPAFEADLKKGRLAIGSGYYAILPSFISYNSANSYPDSLVMMGACRSTFNNTMANAFLSSGAKTYLGYSGYVLTSFNQQVAKEFFHRLLEIPSISNVGDAFIPGQKQGDGVEFQLVGSSGLEKPGSELENGGFESGNLGAWATAGDGRVLSQLGEFLPTEGAFMGIISTGLGFTTTSGSIEQKVCLPADAKRLEFNWNFNSEEFVEYCGSIFQDFFRVEIITASGGTQTIFLRAVDDLCHTVRPSGLHFDQSGPGCHPTPGGFGSGGNDCTVWTTDWQAASIDVAAIAAANQGKAVTIRFSAGDIGDSIFDTAVLLDNIRVTK
jgi:hypothetical protein